ncbi:MAG: GNAT family N-acetyltransferase [Reichenbachiella sp.]|uniref:GNAT family N-acetyltransferase n=1 Tax=Reichenbachiella sp. TaxID=2184521 RepID=UPI0032658FF6
MEIRSISYEMTWSIRQAAMWPNESIAYVMLPNDKEGSHFGLFVNDQMVSVISIFITDGHAQFRKFATLDAEQGKGYGSKLLNHIFLELAKSEITKVWCNARADKTDFYERFGMIQTEKRFDKGGINYVIMEKSI